MPLLMRVIRNKNVKQMLTSFNTFAGTQSQRNYDEVFYQSRCFVSFCIKCRCQSDIGSKSSDNKRHNAAKREYSKCRNKFSSIKMF